MKCPSCETTINDTTYCHHCQTDLFIYNKVTKMTNRLYNKGLEQAQGRCLSGAISTLTTCVRLQKHHIDGRNLLGLVYWEVGEVGQAIKQWVISLSYQKTDNLAAHYLETIQKRPNELEQYSGTIELYNKSLQYMLRGSEDIGIISLRKVISQNPNYIEARVLLSLYYINNDQIEKAKEQLKEVLLINKDHPRATRYWAYVKGDADPEKESKQKDKSQRPKVHSFQPSISKTADSMIRPKPVRGSIFAFVFGAICMFAVYGILIVPSRTASLKEEIKIAEENEMKAEDALKTIQQQQEATIKDLESEKAALEANNEALEKEQAIQKQILILQDAQNLSQNNQWVEAADKLYTVDQGLLQEESKTQLETLRETVYPKAGERLYQDGYSHYQRGEHPEAQQLLEKSYRYAKEEYYSSNTLYTLGRSFEDEEDFEKAKQYYQTTIDDYPGTNGAANANWRLNGLD